MKINTTFFNLFSTVLSYNLSPLTLKVMSLLLYYTLCSTLALAIILITLAISESRRQAREITSPFECGFDPKISTRLPFSSRFFLLAVIFLIFDIELVLLIPVPLSSCYYYQPLTLSLPLAFFVLLLGLLHE